jgi:hypothetical protein
MDYSISGNPVFDSIMVSNFNLKDSKTIGTSTRITDIDNSMVLQLHDNPAAVINIITTVSIAITFDLATEVKASKEDNLVKIETDNLTAFITATNATSIDIMGENIKIEFDRGIAVFRAVPVNMPMEKEHVKFMQEMMKNRAGAEISVGAYGKYSIVNYSEDMGVMITTMDGNRIRMIINSTEPSGRFFMMNIDNSSLTWTERQIIHMYLDNRPMRQVMTSDELFAARESSFWLTMQGGNRMQAMMYIANFSERVVDVVVEEEGTPAPAGTTEVPGPAAATPTPGFDIVVGLLGAGLVYYLRRK